MIHAELSNSVVGAAMILLNTLKAGPDEKIDERALRIGPEERGHRVDVQREFPVFYRGREIGTLIPHLIIDGLVLVDTKVV